MFLEEYDLEGKTYYVCVTFMLPGSCRCSPEPSVGVWSLQSGSQQTPVAVGKGKGGWVTSSLTVPPLYVVLPHRNCTATCLGLDLFSPL